MEPLDVSEELSALSAIYQECFEIISESPLSFKVRFDHGTLQVDVTEDYPNIAPTTLAICERDSGDFNQKISQFAESKVGECMLYEICDLFCQLQSNQDLNTNETLVQEFKVSPV